MRERVHRCWTLISLGLLVASPALRAVPDVSFWTVRETGTTAHLRGVTYGAPTFVVVGDHGTVLASSGAHWERIEAGVTNDLTGIAWANGSFVAVGSAGTVLASRDGMNWTRSDSSVGEMIRCVTSGGDSFLALGSTNSLMSKDGILWSRYSVPMMNAESVCYGNGRFVSVGGRSIFDPGGEIGESADGQTWRLWPQGFSVYHDVLFANGSFMAVGEGLGTDLIRYALLWRAPGIVEQGGPEIHAASETLRGIAFGDGIFVSVGGTRAVPNQWWIGQISSSTTGGNPWTNPDRLMDPWPQTYFQLENLLLDVAFGAGKFVAVGENGTLVESGTAARFDPRLTRVQPNRPVQFGMASPTGSRLQIDATADLQTWSNLMVATNASGTLTFQVTPQGKAGFFRATLLP